MKAREKITRHIRTDYLLLFALSGLVFLLIVSIIVLASVPPVFRRVKVDILSMRTEKT